MPFTNQTENCPAATKCRLGLARLSDLGIEPSIPPVGSRPKPGPDAFLTDANGRTWLGIVWSGDTLQPKLIEDPRQSPTLEDVIGSYSDWIRAQPFEQGPTPPLIVFAPVLTDEDCQTGKALTVLGKPLFLLGRRACAKPERIAEAIRAFSADQAPMEPAWKDRWRAATVPETVIDSPSRTRRRIERDSDTPAAPLLLDYDQERCAKLDLEPILDLGPVARDLRVRLITGVAGCGKTLILLHRAALLARHFPATRVLVVSHNRPLIADLDRRLARRRSQSGGGRIECRTFLQWLRSVSPPRCGGDKLLDARDTVRWIESHLRENGKTYPNLPRHSASWLAEELGWLFDHGHFGDVYLTVERRGRGVALQPSQRQDILALARSYRDYLIHEKKSDWNEWPFDAWEQWGTRTTAPPLYDHLLIDEAQFFAPIWLDLLRRALKPRGHLFLCADPTQGFLKRRQSWSSLGIDMRNRSLRLERPYRSTRAILAYAERFYRQRLPDDDEPLNLPSPAWLDTIPEGQPPSVIPIAAGEGQLRRLIDDLEDFRHKGGHLSDVLVLIAGQRLSSFNVVNRLASRLGAASVGEIKSQRLPEDALGVAHLMAATGLEKPVVFLLGIDDLFDAENDPTLAPEVRMEHIRDHTRQIYVGLTRAMERLVIYARSNELPEPEGRGYVDQTGSDRRSNPV